jgi:hypothetical protein
MSSYPQANTSGPLYDPATNLPAYGCAAAPASVCWYRLKQCSDDADADLWLAGNELGLALEPDPESGECPPMPARHVYDVDDPTCYYVPAGQPGTTTTPATGLPATATEIADCESCGTAAGYPCTCVVDEQECIVKSIQVQIAGTTINPACCAPPGGTPDTVHYQCLNQGVFNGTYTLPKHNGHGTVFVNPACYFRLERDVSTVFKLLSNPDADVEDCVTYETAYNGTDTLAISAGPGVFGSVTATLFHEINVPGLFAFFTLGTPTTDFPCPDPTTDPVDAADDGSACAAHQEGTTWVGNFSFGDGTISATATLDCAEEPLP